MPNHVSALEMLLLLFFYLIFTSYAFNEHHQCIYTPSLNFIT